ncbi:MAG: hypothetical protein ACRDRI_14880 [Pseudonocardiaceae bacterium]
MAEPVVLVVGDAGDWSVAEVGRQLDTRGVRWVLLDAANGPRRCEPSPPRTGLWWSSR